jgi:hypothetical protein
VHRQVLEDLLGWAAANGLPPAGLIRSPIKGTEGNVEFLVWLRPGAETGLEVGAAVEGVMEMDEGRTTNDEGRREAQ